MTGLVALCLLATACSGGAGRPAGGRLSSARAPVLAHPLELAVPVVPPGWVPVDLGYAQIAVPSIWQVNYGPPVSDLGCPVGAPGVLAVDEPWVVTIPYGACGREGVGFPPTTTEVVLGPLPPGHPAGVAARVNGLRVLREPKPKRLGAHLFQVVLVPALGASIAVWGALGGEVLGTLSPSPRAVLLSQPALPARVPRGWRWRTVDGVRFATPATWAYLSTDAISNCDNWVALGARYVVQDFVYKEPASLGGTWVARVLPDRPQVLVDSDLSRIGAACAAPSGSSECVAGDGVRVDTGLPPPSGLAGAPVLRLGGLPMRIDPAAPLDILTLVVDHSGLSQPLQFSIGLGDEQAAATVLSSLRAG